MQHRRLALRLSFERLVSRDDDLAMRICFMELTCVAIRAFQLIEQKERPIFASNSHVILSYALAAKAATFAASRLDSSGGSLIVAFCREIGTEFRL